MPIKYLETHSTDPSFNLAFEEYVLKNYTEGEILILWQNDNTVVIGQNQNAAEEINADFVKEHSVTVVRRTTGGGAVYHDMGNLNYSFITMLGNAEELSIEKFSEPVCKALKSLGVAAKTSGRNDIVVDGKKVSGVAQRIYKNRILHHGTLLFSANTEMVVGSLKADSTKFQSKSAKSVRSRVGNIKDYMAEDMTIEMFWQKLLEILTIDGAETLDLSETEIQEINKNADEKYRTWDWTYKRSPKSNYKNRQRFEGGLLEVSIEIKDATIADIAFSGDFMAKSPIDKAETALRGIKYEKSAVEKALQTVDVQNVFGMIKLDQILDIMFA